MVERFKYILAVSIAVLLFIPAFQFKTELFKCEPLSGGITVSEKPELTKESYWDLSWQENYNKYINDNFGFRPWFVRLINQINFSLFNTTNAPGVVIGKNGELFIESYIDDYIGRNYIGGGKVNENVTKIKRVQDSLKARGIDLIVLSQRGRARQYLAFDCSVLGDHRNSGKWALAAIAQYEKADSIPSAQWAESYTAAGVAAWHLGRIREAERYYMKALEKLGEASGKAVLIRKESAYGNLGVLWQNAGDFTRAKNYYHESLRYSDRVVAVTQDPFTRDEAIVNRSRTYVNLATVYFQTRRQWPRSGAAQPGVARPQQRDGARRCAAHLREGAIRRP